MNRSIRVTQLDLVEKMKHGSTSEQQEEKGLREATAGGMVVQNETVNWRGEAARKDSTGGIPASCFVLGELVADRVAFDGISASLVTYLTTEMGLDNATASMRVNQWNGTAFLSAILGGFMADAYLGRFKTILLFSSTFLMGMILLTNVVSINHLSPCIDGGNTCSKSHIGLFYFAIYLIAVTSGASKPCASAFGGDQFDDSEEHDKRRKSSFFNWWFFFQSSANVVALTLIMALQQEKGWTWGYGVPTTFLGIVLLLYASGAPIFRYGQVKGSPLTQIARVIVVAIRNRRVSAFDPSSLCQGDEIELSNQGKTKLVHTNRFRWLDKAAFIEDNKLFNICNGKGKSMNRWSLCNVTEVEEVKMVVQTIPIWLSLIPFSIATAQTHSLFIKQASSMDRELGNILVPSASIAVFQTITMVLFLPIYDRVFVPSVSKFTGHHRGITLLQRMGIGIALATIAMATAALVERKRLIAFHNNHTISVFWLLPQYVIIGLALSFTSIGRLEFFYDQFPNSLRSLGTSLYLANVGVANFLSSALIAIVNRATRYTHDGMWIGPKLNSSHVDYFYWLLASFCFLDLFIFNLLSRWYKYRNTNSHVNV